MGLGFPCVHSGGIHDRVMEHFVEPEVFDPLGVCPSNRAITLAVGVSAIVLALMLTESVTPEGIILFSNWQTNTLFIYLSHL